MDVELYSRANPFYTIGQIEDISLLKKEDVDIHFNDYAGARTEIEELKKYYNDDCKKFYLCVINRNKVVVINS